MRSSKLEILEANYWEHFKFLKDLSLIYSKDHPKRIELETELSKMLTVINELKHEAE